MRQVVKLLRVVGKANLVTFYESILSYGIVQGVKLPSLSEFLESTLKEGPESNKAFDPEADRVLEERALKILNERQTQHG